MSKKTESIEVRVSPELKAKLGEMAETRGTAMSAVVRDLIIDEASGAEPKTTMLRSYALSGAILVGLGILTSAGQNQPASAQMTARMTFAEMDVNEDNSISAEEFAMSGGLFVSTAFSGGGIYLSDEQLTPECLAYLEAETPIEDDITVQEFQALDANADGRLGFGEMQNGISKTFFDDFNALDEDVDGRLTLSEYGQLEVQDEPEPEFAAACNVSPEFEDELVMQDLRISFAALDVDRDAHLSLTEYIQQ